MSFPVRLEWSTASVGSSHAPTDAVDHSAPSAIRPESTYISGKVVQTNGATSATRPQPAGHTRLGGQTLARRVGPRPVFEADQPVDQLSGPEGLFP